MLLDSSIQLALSAACHVVCVANGVTVTVDSTIIDEGGPASIVKKGDGTLVLNGDNTFSGGVTVKAGELVLGSSMDVEHIHGPVGTGTLTLYGGSYLTPGVANVKLANAIVLTEYNDDSLVHIDEDDSTNNLTLTGMISGTGGLDWCTEGTLTLTNAGNTFSGGDGGVSVDLRAGKLLIGASSTATWDGSYTVTSGPVGTGTLALYDDTTLGVVPLSGAQTLHNTIYLASDGTVTFDTSGGDLTLLGDIIGESEVVKTGSGILTLGGTGDFSGGVTVTAGKLYLASSSSNSDGISGPVGRSALTLLDGTTLGVAPGADGLTTLHNNILLDGSADTNVNFDTANGDLTLKGTISGASSLTKIGSGYLTLTNANSYSGGTIINAGFLVLGQSTTGLGTTYGSITGNVHFTGSTDLGGGELQFIRSDAYTFAGNITGPGRVTNFGTGTVTFSGTNTYSGGTFLHDGTLTDNAAGNFSPNSTVYVNSGATLQVNHNETIAGLDDYSGAHGGVGITGSTLTINIPTESGEVFTGVISGNGTLAKTGLGTQTLNGNNTYGGGTSLSGGVLQIGNAGALGTGTLTAADGTTLQFGNSFTFSNALVLSGGTFNVGLVETGSVISGTISGSGVMNLASGYQFTLSGNNSGWAGGLNIAGSAGVHLGNTSLGTGALSFGPSSNGYATFSGTTPSIGGLSGGTSNAEIFLSAEATLTINQASNTTFYGHFDAGGGASIVKSGTGSLTLAQANSYNGGTTVNQGTLVYGANGAFGSGSVTLNGGSISVGSGLTLTNPLTFSGSAIVLGGNGTIGSAITVDSHVVLSPGNSPGNLTFSAGLTLASGGAISFQVLDANGPAGTGYDLITVSGGILALTASANTITFNLVSIDGSNNSANAINFNPANSYSWIFASSPNSLITGFNSNQFHLVNGFTNNLAGGTFSFSESGDQHSLLLNFTPAAVPEPSTWALLVAGLGAVTVISRRRRRT